MMELLALDVITLLTRYLSGNAIPICFQMDTNFFIKQYKEEK